MALAIVVGRLNKGVGIFCVGAPHSYSLVSTFHFFTLPSAISLVFSLPKGMHCFFVIWSTLATT